MADRNPMSGIRKFSLLLADESVLLREGLAALCESFGPYQVVAQCSDGEQAFSLISTIKPDVAILEDGISKLYILEVLRKLQCLRTATRVVVLSARTDRKMVIDALRGGASGYLLKTCLVHELRDALEQVLNGGVYVARQAGPGNGWTVETTDPTDDPLESLSSREHQVFSLLVQGLRAKEIAARLGLSPKTVGTFRSILMRKLDIHDLAGLVKFAVSRKLT
jgi:DNA-binding NarL/FixJ family response regulator